MLWEYLNDLKPMCAYSGLGRTVMLSDYEPHCSVLIVYSDGI